MNRKILSSLLVLYALGRAEVSAAPHTMRLDYYHIGQRDGGASSALDRIVVEPLAWPGNPAPARSTTRTSGKYLFEVVDRGTNRVLFSRGFASIYGEWETTEERRRANRTFHESLRFPAPDGPVQIVLKKRDSDNAFREIWSTLVDPEGQVRRPVEAGAARAAPRDREERAIRPTRSTS